MEIISTTKMLADAHNKKYGIAAFNVENMEMCKAIIEVAQEFKSPVILQTSKNTLKYSSPFVFSNIVKAYLKDKTIPVSLHLDHGNSLDLVIECIKAGYSSIMIDGSALSFIDNVNLTKQVTNICNAFEVPVEGELGAIGGKKDDDNLDLAYTKPEIARDFVDKTNVTSLAVAIGTAHGIYKSIPKLDFVRLKEINDMLNIPLVLHGASGLSDQQIRECIKNGINKINFATELRMAYSNAIREFLEKNNKEYDPKKYGTVAIESIKKVVRDKLKLCDSIGRAYKINPKLIVFDFDGTIVDSEKIYKEFWIKASEFYGYTLTEEMALNLRSLDSTLARELFFNWFKDYDIYDKIRAKRKELMEDWSNKNKYELKSYIIDALNYLKNKGYPLAVVTAGDKISIDNKLKELNIFDKFNDIISAKSVKRGKPYPDIYYSLMKEKNLRASDILVVEDSPNGVMSAYEAGCDVIMIPDLTWPDNSIINKLSIVLPDASFIKNML